MKYLCLLAAIFLFSTALAVPTGEERAIHRGPRDLSEEEHYQGDGHDHNAQYDHEAFLGKEQAERFDQLSQDEAKRRLGIIVDKIDKDGDGRVTEEELKKWVKQVSRRYILDDVDRHWSYHDKDNDGFISLQEYKDTSYGVIEDKASIYDEHRQLTYSQVIARDEKRFKAADKDGDDKMNREEYADFLHPEEPAHMRHIVVEETMYDMDKNKDGKITLEEYISDIWPQFEREEGAEEPDWVKTEREHFNKHRDKNSDGSLDKDEISNWISPPDYDHAHAEAKHLIYEADTNKDKVLSKEEILAHQDLFVGSQATDFGDYFLRHDEF